MLTKYRPVHWSDISLPEAPIVGWGIERKLSTERRYKPIGWEGQVHPFASKAEAQIICDKLNTEEKLKNDNNT